MVKNKVAPPFRNAEFEVLYGEGISREGELVDLGVQLEFMQKSGSWYSYSGDRIGQGKDNVRNFLKEHPDVADDLEKKIRAKAFGGAEPLVAKLTAKSDPIPVDDVL